MYQWSSNITIDIRGVGGGVGGAYIRANINYSNFTLVVGRGGGTECIACYNSICGGGAIGTCLYQPHSINLLLQLYDTPRIDRIHIIIASN